jgi:hypothetical protein
MVLPRRKPDKFGQKRSWLLLGLVVVLLLPIYGPWVDLHFAAHQPNHKHLYLGKIDLHHHRNSDSKDVVNLPDQDATGRILALVCLPEEQAVGLPDDKGLFFGLLDDYRSPQDAFLPPPERPPTFS